MITKKLCYYKVTFTVVNNFGEMVSHSMEFDRMMYVEDYVDTLKEVYGNDLVSVMLETYEEIEI